MSRLLEINHCRKNFGANEVLKDLSLSVEEGQVLSIIGPSGSGKSTLLRCATLLETMDGGDLMFTHRRRSCRKSGTCSDWCFRISICSRITPY